MRPGRRDRGGRRGRRRMTSERDAARDSQAMAPMRWEIGDITVTRVMELPTMAMEPDDLLQTTREVVARHDWLQPDYVTPDLLLRANIQAFVIEAGGKRIMVDPCVGNDKPREGQLFSMLQTPFLERLAVAGYPRESIDFVLCTHLHFDHCGWNTMLVSGEWVPTFPNARYLFARAEYACATKPEGEEEAAVYRDSVRPVMAAGLVDLVDPLHEIVSGVRLEPSPGHTPGHCCVTLDSRGQTAMITGDAIHHPLQAAEPDICSLYCWDKTLAVASRKSILEIASITGATLFGSHFPEPTAVRVRKAATGWRMDGVRGVRGSATSE